jgi:hypothetical protein
VNGLARTLVLAFLSMAHCGQPQGNIWRCDWNGLRHCRACTTCFIEYPAAQCPLILEKCAWKRTVSSAIESMRQNARAYETLSNSTTVSAQKLSENCSWCLDWNVRCGFTSLKVCMLRKFSIPFLLKPASSVRNIRLLKKGPSPLSKEPLSKFMAWAISDRTKELVPVANGTTTVIAHGEPTTRTLSWAPHVLLQRCPRTRRPRQRPESRLWSLTANTAASRTADVISQLAACVSPMSATNAAAKRQLSSSARLSPYTH